MEGGFLYLPAEWGPVVGFYFYMAAKSFAFSIALLAVWVMF